MHFKNWRLFLLTTPKWWNPS